MHFYTFKPHAPAVRTGTADAETVVEPTSHGRGGSARHRVAISTSGENRATAADLSGRKSTFRALAGLPVATDADRCVSYGEREVADRMNVPLGIGSRRSRAE